MLADCKLLSLFQVGILYGACLARKAHDEKAAAKHGRTYRM